MPRGLFITTVSVEACRRSKIKGKENISEWGGGGADNSSDGTERALSEGYLGII